MIVGVVALLIPIVVFPDRYLPAASAGLNIFILNVFPALFPFLFFSSILSNLNFGYDLGILLKKPLKKIYNAPPLSGYILVMSMLCGYPVGSKMLCDFYVAGLIDREDCRKISSFTSTSGPLFLIGTVGINMLGNKTAGYIMLVSHYLSALINGVLFRKKGVGKNKDFLPPIIDGDNLLRKSMTGSVSSMAIVGGYIVVFNLVLAILADLSIIDFFAYPLSFLLGREGSVGVVSGIVEMTKGCLILSRSPLPINLTVPLCTFVVTVGGLSVTLQSMTFLSKIKISPIYYLVTKGVQGIISFLISWGICSLIY